MTVKINYNTNSSKKNSSNIVLFSDENFSISGLKKHISGSEYSFIADLIKTKDIKKKILIDSSVIRHLTIKYKKLDTKTEYFKEKEVNEKK